MATLKDIAVLTGVSVNTVSRALRDMPDIGEATKKRVRQTADTLSYTPNANARGLVLRRTYVIGALVTELSNPARGMILRELRELLRKQGYQLLIESYEGLDEVSTHLRTMASRGVDGLLIGNLNGILAEQDFWPDLQGIIQSGIPVVAFFNAVTSKVDRVVCDYSSIAEQLTRHLIEEHGLRRIAYCGESRTSSRAAGYQRAMEAAGLTSSFLSLPYWSLQGTRDGLADFLAAHPAPEGIVCHNDLTAIGIMAGLHKVGRSVPGDVAVVGTDNIEMGEFLNPPLTTAGVAPSVVAGALSQLLLDRIERKQPSTGRQVNLDFKLYLRDSCGCGHSQ